MLFSKACHFSGGIDLNHQDEAEFPGCFIVGGKRRFIPLTKTLVHNFPFRFFIEDFPKQKPFAPSWLCPSEKNKDIYLYIYLVF